MRPSRGSVAADAQRGRRGGGEEQEEEEEVWEEREAEGGEVWTHSNRSPHFWRPPAPCSRVTFSYEVTLNTRQRTPALTRWVSLGQGDVFFWKRGWREGAGPPCTCRGLRKGGQVSLPGNVCCRSGQFGSARAHFTWMLARSERASLPVGEQLHAEKTSRFPGLLCKVVLTDGIIVVTE